MGPLPAMQTFALALPHTSTNSSLFFSEVGVFRSLKRKDLIPTIELPCEELTSNLEKPENEFSASIESSETNLSRSHEVEYLLSHHSSRSIRSAIGLLGRLLKEMINSDATAPEQLIQVSERSTTTVLYRSNSPYWRIFCFFVSRRCSYMQSNLH